MDAGCEKISCWPPESDDEAYEHAKKKSKFDEHETKPNNKKYAGFHKMSNKKESKEKPNTFLIANVALAKWYKAQHLEVQTSIMGNLSASSNPKTLLNFISRCEEGKNFLHQEAQKISLQITSSEISGFRLIDSLAILCTYYEKLEDVVKAKEYMEQVIITLKELKEQNIDIEKLNEILWQKEKITKQFTIHEEQNKFKKRNTDKHIFMPKFCKVPRVSANDLTVEEFYRQYSSQSEPVIITDLVQHMTTQPWDLHHISQCAGKCKVTLKRLCMDSLEWARLENSEITTVEEFIDNLKHQSLSPVEDKRYLFDWSIPLYSPVLAEEIIIPKYFANDYLLRLSSESMYYDSWPSLFISPAGLRSELHVDAFGSNFWMALFEGTKRWTFFPKEETPLLYPKFDNSLDPLFEVDLSDPDLTRHQLLAHTHPKQCDLQAGEVLFVPAGCAHRVENLEQSLAISANFIDTSNYTMAMEQLTVNALIDERAKSVVEQFKSVNFNKKMNFNCSHTKLVDLKR